MSVTKDMPQEDYFTIGELAEKMGVTVRTLQHYDQKGLLSPSAKSQGGRRLYSEKNLIQLHQILALKSLGFSLNDIKDRLPALETPEDVAATLSLQAEMIKSDIKILSKSQAAIEKLKEEVLHMQTVDFKTYADIIMNLQMNNQYYYLIKDFDKETLKDLRTRFDKDQGEVFLRKFNAIIEDLENLQAENAPPDGEESQRSIKEFWELIDEFLDGDIDLLPKLFEMGNRESGNSELDVRQEKINEYIGLTSGVYFSKTTEDPLKEVRTDD